MKRMLIWLLIATLLSSAAIPAHGAANEQKEDMIKEAYVVTLPLLMVKATEIKATNTIKATRLQAPVNQLIHAEKLADTSSRDVVTPNVDTIYTQAFIDLSEDALILELPRTDRFALMQFLDAYTNTVTIIDCMKHEEERTRYILTGPNWQGNIPEGMVQLSFPTNMGWMIGRVICYGPDDRLKVYDVQQQMDAYTLSAFLNGSTAQKPDGEFDPEENFNPRDYVLHLGMKEYFDMANALMLANPPAAEEAQLMEKLSAIGVGPGLNFDPSIFGSEQDMNALWTSTVQAVVAPEYRLAGKAPYPAALQDCYAALLYLKEHAGELGVNPGSIMVGGESAGGGLTAALCMYARDKGEVDICFQMPLYPMIDDRDTPSSRDNHGISWNTRRNHAAWKLYLSKVQGEPPPYAAPARQTDYANLPPCYTFVGDREPFYCETLSYIENLRKAGVEAHVDVYSTGFHAFDMLLPFRRISRQAIAAFESAYLQAFAHFRKSSGHHSH